MYLHRLVIDANCINAKNLLPAMAELEKYHLSGAIELLVTTTLGGELDRSSSQAHKAAQYQVVGGGYCYFQSNNSAQSMPGACVRESLLEELQRELFGNSLTGHTLERALRDCLHLDQAQMNAADMFITNDKRLYRAPQILQRHGVSLIVTSPDDALDFVRSYLKQTMGSSAHEDVEVACHGLGPLILGSNSLGPCSFIDPTNAEHIVDFEIVDGLLRVNATLRNHDGEIILETNPGKRPLFHREYVRVTQVGRGPILVGEEPCASVVFAGKGCVHIAMRTTHTGRVVVYDMILRDKRGVEIVLIRGDALELRGAFLYF